MRLCWLHVLTPCNYILLPSFESGSVEILYELARSSMPMILVGPLRKESNVARQQQLYYYWKRSKVIIHRTIPSARSAKGECECGVRRGVSIHSRA